MARLINREIIIRRRRCTLSATTPGSYGTISSAIGPVVMGSTYASGLLSPTDCAVCRQDRDEDVCVIFLGEHFEGITQMAVDRPLAHDQIHLATVWQPHVDVASFHSRRPPLSEQKIIRGVQPRGLPGPFRNERQPAVRDHHGAVFDPMMGIRRPDDLGLPETVRRASSAQRQQPTGGGTNQDRRLCAVLPEQHYQNQSQRKKAGQRGNQPVQQFDGPQFSGAPRGVTAMWMRYRSARYQDVHSSMTRSPAWVTRSWTSKGARLVTRSNRARRTSADSARTVCSPLVAITPYSRAKTS